MKSCAVLFSGGLDSTTVLSWALSRYVDVTALTFDYRQRHRIEITASRKIVRKLGVPQVVLKVDLTQIGGSALTDSSVPLPAVRKRPGLLDGSPSTYVPFRNGVFLALAAAWAEAHEISHLICGFHVLDSPDYPDTRENFVRAMERAVNRGTNVSTAGSPIRILAPLIRMCKADIIRRGIKLGVDYSRSVSCYAGKEIPCGTCSSCRLRDKAWKEVGIEDPLLGRLRKEGKL